MSSSAKRKSGGADGGDRPGKKSKGGNAGQWRTPAHEAKMARLGDRGAVLEVGDQGVWVTFARGMERKAAGEFKRLCDDLGHQMYNIAPPQDNPAIQDGDDEDIEVSIKKELEGYNATKSHSPSEKRPFSVVRVVMDCVLFVKMRPPVQPVEFCRRICEDAKACTNLMERKTRYINRLTPVTAMDKASGNGIERAVKQALAPWFTLANAAAEVDDSGGFVKEVTSSADKQSDNPESPAYTYAIRQSIRNNTEIKNADLIKQVANLIDTRHKVNLSSPDKVILVDIFQSFCGVGVINGTDWDGLRKLNVNELYKLSSSGQQSTAQPSEKAE